MQDVLAPWPRAGQLPKAIFGKKGNYSQALTSASRRNGPDSLQRLVVIGVLPHLRDVLAVGDLAGLVQDENGPRQQRDRQALDQHPIAPAERLVVPVGQRLHVLDVLRRAKALLGELHVPADPVTSQLIL